MSGQICLLIAALSASRTLNTMVRNLRLMADPAWPLVITFASSLTNTKFFQPITVWNRWKRPDWLKSRAPSYPVDYHRKNRRRTTTPHTPPLGLFLGLLNRAMRKSALSACFERRVVGELWYVRGEVASPESCVERWGWNSVALRRVRRKVLIYANCFHRDPNPTK